MLKLLPTELLLKTLAHLEIHDLKNVQRLSHAYNTFFVSNEESIFRQAAVTHELTTALDGSLEEAKAASPTNSMTDVHCWKDFGTFVRLRFHMYSCCG